ncbi:laccase 2 precursor [Tricholoma matsutake]|nr:laccase 2 precursor [Tricholoma matsutake 945]
MMLLAAASALVLLSGTYAAIGPFADLYIVNKNIQPDGYSRSAVLAGGTPESASFPGPLIRGVKGDRFLLNVVDLLTDSTMLKSTSIHWHGIFQRNTSWADGTAFVTQCPIVPGYSFLYDFTVLDQAGTFWYHSHLSTQYCDGLRGAFVIYDPHDPHSSLYDVDDESTVLTFADWFHFPASSVPPGVTPTANSTLINGLGRYLNGPPSPLAIVNVVQGKRYRLRLVSISCDEDFTISIDGHTLTIIEVDGINSELLVVDSVQIFAGQRYSVVLNANQMVDNYWIRTQPNSEVDGGLNLAILRYAGATIADPTTMSDLKNPMLETNLHPLENPGAPGQPRQGGADVTLNLNIAYNFTSSTYTMNGATFNPPPAPVLLQILSGARSAHDLLPPGSIYPLPPNKVIEVSIPGIAKGAPHPFHLHGHHFDVVRSAGSSVYNYHNPVRRDVVSNGGPGDNMTLRFRTDNAGPWFLHCHVEWHLHMGLAAVFAEDPNTIAAERHPVAWDALCPIYDSLPSNTH